MPETALSSLLSKIDANQSEINSFRPLDEATEEKILWRLRLDWNYNSNNIEGNSYTYGETKTFLLHGLTAQGKPLKDSIEIKGHNDAIDLLAETVRNQSVLTESDIRELHKMILGAPYFKIAKTPEGKETHKEVIPGKYKTEPNHVLTRTGELFRFTEPIDIPPEMQGLLEW